ncbi:hypothetical protein IFM89_001388 [Coptis chinensis]|uniref:GST C-terminal domain-containing protein n=1 Tax=Coptis chinensis TaxID=261450 RepID=A0A835LQ80_9MAGN|nr:hypothetical protein IFM89_001388 [Coptis chinensis]
MAIYGEVFFNHAILSYLACAFPGVADDWYPVDLCKRAKINSVLDWHHSNLRRGAATYVFHTLLAPVLGLSQNPIEVAEAEKLFTSSLLKLESIWLKGEGNFLLGGFRPSIADISLVCEIMQFEVLKLRGAVVYFDGHMDDSRLNVAIACTVALAGASVLNHAEVVSLHKDKISGRLRNMANNGATNIISPSSSTHVVLPDYFIPKDMGLIISKTKDACVVFMLPWGRKTLVGITDTSSIITDLPKPHEEEIEFILSAIGDYLNIEVQKSDILSTWSGIPPLATDPSSKNTSSISRDHIVNVECPGLITITGGKWTMYRRYYIFLFCMVRLKSVDPETQQETRMIAMGVSVFMSLGSVVASCMVAYLS